MEYFYIGIALIPLFFVGSLANIYTLYCLVKRKQRKDVVRKFGNLETLLFTLTISDTIFSLGYLPIKITIYLLNPTMKEKPRYFGYMDAACFWSSTLITILIAANNYVKIFWPQKYHRLLSRKRIRALVILVMLISAVIPLVIFPAIQIFGALMLLAFVFIIITLFVLYYLIRKTMKRSQTQVESHKTGSNNTENNMRARKKQIAQRKVTKNILVLLLAYSVCCSTLLVCILLYIISPSRSKKEMVKFGGYVMSLNCIIDPCVYVLKNNGLGRKMLRRKVTEKNRGLNIREGLTRDMADSSHVDGDYFVLNKEGTKTTL
ncbi:melanocortin receptor 5-like [Clytia hemisphaerica]|uniref:melanocortin receptor 5-like n=1 Tax=Clytia hemisphaerica TaxID=252671 RepID=UPI0034D3DF13